MLTGTIQVNQTLEYPHIIRGFCFLSPRHVDLSNKKDDQIKSLQN